MCRLWGMYVTHIYVWHDVFIFVSRYDAFICARCRTSYVPCADSETRMQHTCTCVTCRIHIRIAIWRLHMCDMSHILCADSGTLRHVCRAHLYVWHVWVCCDITHTHSYMWEWPNTYTCDICMHMPHTFVSVTCMSVMWPNTYTCESGIGHIHVTFVCVACMSVLWHKTYTCDICMRMPHTFVCVRVTCICVMPQHTHTCHMYMCHV